MATLFKHSTAEVNQDQREELLQNMIIDKAVNEFRLAQSIADLIERNDALKTEFKKLCKKCTTILGYVLSYSCYYDTEYSNEGDKGYFKVRWQNLGIDYRFTGQQEKSDLTWRIKSGFLKALTEENKKITILQDFKGRIDRDTAYDYSESDWYAAKLALIFDVYKNCHNLFAQDNSNPGLVQIGELLKLFSTFCNEFIKTFNYTKKDSPTIYTGDFSIPAGLRQFVTLCSQMPEYKSSRTWNNWGDTAFSNERQSRRKAESMPPHDDVRMRTLQRLGVTVNDDSNSEHYWKIKGILKFELTYGSVIGRMDDILGLLKGADVSGTTCGYIFVIEQVLLTNFQLDQDKNLSPVVVYSGSNQNAIDKCFNPHLTLITFATIVAKQHHTILEVALALSIISSESLLMKYTPGIYTSLINTAEMNFPWIPELKNILLAAENHESNKLMLVAPGSLAVYGLDDTSGFKTALEVGEPLYRLFITPNLSPYSQQDKFQYLKQKIESGSRIAFTQVAESQILGSSWQTGYPHGVEARQSGSPNFSWKKYAWKDLSAAEKEQWIILGWDENTWNNNYPVPGSCFKLWNELSDDQVNAATLLGFTYYTWGGSGDIYVNNAYWGLFNVAVPIKESSADVTLQVQSMINIAVPAIPCNHEILEADPAPGKKKSLYIRYTTKNGDTIEKMATEKDEIHISFTKPAVAKINAALYGILDDESDGRKADVTRSLQLHLDNTLTKVKCSNEVCGIDPAYGKKKQLKVTYTLPSGVTRTKTVMENDVLVID